MNIIDKYIAKTVLSAILLVTLVLVGLETFILFVAELDNLGRGDYGVMQAFVYVLLQMPYQVYLFFPVASLLGSLIGLGLLANSSELIVIRSSGMSIYQIILAVLKMALFLIVFVTVLGETVVPKLVYYSSVKKAIESSGGKAISTAKGVWLISGSSFINVGRVLPNYHLKNVTEYKFDNQHNLSEMRFIESAEYRDGAWFGKNIQESKLNSDHVLMRHYAENNWDIELAPQLLKVANIEPDEMNLKELYNYITVKKKNFQSAGNYELAYWQRLLQPIATCVMMFLAIPFIFGPLRSATFGSRILAGATVGFGFHMLNKFFGPISQVYQLPPIIGAIGPILLFALLAFFMLKRVH